MQELTNNRYETLYPKTSTTQINGIENYDWQIGDIRSTARTDLGDKWLLCNGSVIDTSNEYSDVGDLLGKETDAWLNKQKFPYADIFGFSVSSPKVSFSNGKVLIVALRYESSTTSVWIASSESANGPWVVNQVYSRNDTNSIYPAGCVYYEANNSFYLGAVDQEGMQQLTSKVYASTDLSNWTQIYNSGYVNHQQGLAEITNMVAWSGGVAFAMGITWYQTQTNHAIFIVSYDGNSWVNKSIFRIKNGQVSYGGVTRIEANVANDVPFVTAEYTDAGSEYSESQGYGKKSVICWRTRTSSWKYQMFVADTDPNQQKATISNVIYKENSFQAIESYYRTINSQFDGTTALVKLTNLNGTWNITNIQNDTTSKISPYYIFENAKREFWLFYKNATVQKVVNLENTLVDSVSIKGLTSIGRMVKKDDATFFINNTDEYIHVNSISTLPNITIDKGYAYIKAKEGE